MSVHIVDLRTEEGKKEHKQLQDGWARAWKENAIDAIHEHARFRFTANGQFYSMVLDGEFIGYLMLADNGYDFREHPQLRSELRSIAGAIVVYDEHGYGVLDEILTYGDRQELIAAWRELHQISGVVMSDADAERLAEYDEEDDNE